MSYAEGAEFIEDLLRQPRERYEDWVRSVAFSPGGKHMVSASDEAEEKEESRKKDEEDVEVWKCGAEVTKHEEVRKDEEEVKRK